MDTMADSGSGKPCPLLSLPSELLTLVAEKLEKLELANFAAASAICQAAAQRGLRAALLVVVTRSMWLPGSRRMSDALVACPYFCLPDDLIAIPPGALCRCKVNNLILPDSITSIGNFAFKNCWSLISITLPASLTSISTQA